MNLCPIACKQKKFCQLLHDMTSIVRGILISKTLKWEEEMNTLEPLKHGNAELE